MPASNFQYFYPRPPGGGRPIPVVFLDMIAEFLSTPSGWRATCAMLSPSDQSCISIHALRVEGDFRGIGCRQTPTRHFYPRPPGGGRLIQAATAATLISLFLSTPSGWRATPRENTKIIKLVISIHALRVEGDNERPDISVRLPVISIHALRVEGDRKATSRRCSKIISIHALRVEGDLLSISPPASASKFLSTPSGWRATICAATLSHE